MSYKPAPRSSLPPELGIPDGYIQQVMTFTSASARTLQRKIDNRGGFMLIEPFANRVVAGERFDLNAEDVIAYCAPKE